MLHVSAFFLTLKVLVSYLTEFCWFFVWLRIAKRDGEKVREGKSWETRSARNPRSWREFRGHRAPQKVSRFDLFWFVLVVSLLSVFRSGKSKFWYELFFRIFVMGLIFWVLGCSGTDDLRSGCFSNELKLQVVIQGAWFKSANLWALGACPNCPISD